MVTEFDSTTALQPTVDQEKARLKKLFETDDVIFVGHSFVYLVNQEIVAKNSLFSKDFDESDYGSLSDDFAEFLGVRNGNNAERLKIRRQISDAGHEFYVSIGEVDSDLQDIAGMFMGANKEYVLNHSGEQETNGTVDILRTGFLTNQKRMIQRVRDRLVRLCLVSPVAPSPESIESTGFSAENINSVLTAPDSAGRPAAERAIFTMARTCVRLTAVRVGVIKGELDRHLLCLHKGILIRTPEQQASLSIADIDKAIAELQKARDVLSGVSAAVD